MTSTKSAIRYAKALVDLCLSEGKLERIEGDLNHFIRVMEGSNDFRVFLLSPVIRGDKKIAIYQKVFEEFDPLTLRFFKLVTNNGREQLLPEIARQFNRLLEQHRNIVSGTITSAVPLNAITKTAIIEKIARSFQGKLALTEHVDASLIGGFVVRIEDKQIDASVVSKLKQLKQELVK